ncbi:MAG: MFS transporter [Candidatus Rokubacteria bacterium]|nr:MFS transporter [Candidatus Rokubacteria bacterium]
MTVVPLRGPGVRSLGVTFVTLGLVYGIWYSYSVFLVALLREFGWSRSVLAGAFSVFALVHGFSGLGLGWLGDRFGPRRLVIVGGVLLTVAVPLNGAVNQPWQLYATFGLLTAVGVATAGWVPAVILVQRWFPQRLGVALGVASSGVGMGIFLVVPLAQFLIDAGGWRWAFRVLGALMLAWVVPASVWLVRDPPAVPASSATADRTRSAAGPVAAPASAARIADTIARHGVTLGQALRTWRFWALGIIQILGNMASQMLLVHQVAYLVDHRIPAIVAATVVSVVGLSSIAGKMGGGWFSDAFGRELAYTIGMACLAASIGVLGVVALAPNPRLAYVYAVLIGVGYAATAPLMPAVISDLFRGRHYGAIFGALHVSNAMGGAFGPWLAGRIFDATGSYQAAFMTAVFTASLSAAGLWIVAPRRARPG